MKKIFYFFLLVGFSVLNSCSDNLDSDNTVTFINLTADITSGDIGSIFTFTVEDNLGHDITAETTFEVGELVLESNVFQASASGEFVVLASYGTLADAMIINVNSATPSITLSASATNVSFGENVTFTVIDESNVDVTQNVQIFINDQELEGNVFMPTNGGVYDVVANYGVLTSNTISVTVEGPEPNSAYYNEENTTFNNSRVFFYGLVDLVEDASTTPTHAKWALEVYEGDFPDGAPVSSNNYLEVYFYTAIVNGAIQLPGEGNIDYDNEQGVNTFLSDGVSVTYSTEENGSLVFDQEITLSPQLESASFSFTTELDGLPLVLTYNGSFQGLHDASSSGRGVNLDRLLNQNIPIR